MHRQYARKFITMKQERSDYTARDREAIGTCVLEIRGQTVKIIANIIHLKPEHVYKLCLVAVDEDKALCVSAATFMHCGSNKMEAKCELDADNVFQTKMSIEKFNLILVTCGKQTPDIAVPLSGFMDKPLLWKNKLVFFDKSHAHAIEDEGKEEIEAKKPIESKTIEIHEMAEETTNDVPASETNKPETIIYTAPDIIMEEIKPENEEAITAVYNTNHVPTEVQEFIEPIVQMGYKEQCQPEEAQAPNQNESYATEKDFFDTLFFNEWTQNESFAKEQPPEGFDETDYHEAFKMMLKKFNQELEELNAYTVMNEEELTNTYLAKKCDENDFFDILGENSIDTEEAREREITRIFIECVKMRPFQSQKKDITWVRIGINELCALPIDFVKYANSSFVASKYYKYKHLLLGRINVKDQNRFILGVPDAYDQAYKSIAAELEFKQFKPCEGKPLREGVYGYWLMVI